MAKSTRLPPHRPSLMRVGAAYALPDPMWSLFEKYDVPYGDYKRLTWELAGKYERGFKSSKGGRPREMPARQFEELVTFFGKYILDYLSTHFPLLRSTLPKWPEPTSIGYRD